MTRSARSLWSFASAAVFAAVTLALGLLATPLLVRWLGDERFGATRALIDWFAYVGLLEFGLGGAMLPLIARELSRNQAAGLAEVISAGARAYRLVAVWMIGGGAVLLVCVPWLVPVSPSLRGELWFAAGLALAGGPLILLAPLRHFLEASQRSYLVVAAMTVQSVVITSLWVLLAWLGWGIASQAAAMLVGAVLFNGILLGIVWRRRREVVQAIVSPMYESPRRRELAKLNWSTFAVNLAGRISLLSDNIVIGLLLSPAMVTPFFLTQRLAQIAQAQLQNIGTAGWAALAELYNRGEHQPMRARVLELTRLTTAMGFVLLVPIAVLNRTFVELWVGGDRYGGDWLTWLAAFNALVWSIGSLWGWIVSGTGRIGLMVVPSYWTAAINVIVGVGLTAVAARAEWPLALIGPLIGTATALTFVALPWLAFLLRRDFGIGARSLAWALAQPALVLAVPAATVLAYAVKFPPVGWLWLLIQMAASGCVLATVVWIAVLSQHERSLWKLRFKLALGR